MNTTISIALWYSGGNLPIGMRRLHRYVKHAARKLWMTQELRSLLACHATLTVVSILESLYTAVYPCVLSSDVYSETCSTPLKALLLVQAAKVGVASCVLSWGIAKSVLAPEKFELMRPKLRSLCRCFLANGTSDTDHLMSDDPSNCAVMTRSWAAASSRDVYEDTVQATRQAQFELILGILVTTMVHSFESYLVDTASWESSEGREYVARVCGECPAAGNWWASPCCMAWRWKELGLGILVTLELYSEGIALMLRPEMRGSAFRLALKESGMRWLSRCLHLHWNHFPLAILLLFSFSSFLRMKFLLAAKWEMTTYYIVFIVSLVWAILVLVWSLDTESAVRSLFNSKARRLSAIRSNTVSDGHEPSSSGGSRLSVRRSTAADVVTKPVTARTSYKHKQLQLMLCLVHPLVSFAMATPWSMAILWIMRVLGIILMLAAEDMKASFEDLEESGAGYGLLLCADYTRCAIRAYLSGREYKGSLLRTRGSYYRMADTMTVSYRWQPEEIRVCPELTLNMSRWQLEELEKALGRSGCLYVWIDRAAVPQTDCELQRTLLSRMMAIYAASKTTLGLRSIEGEGSRYHQRAWTLQEYCNAREVKVITQPDPEDSKDVAVMEAGQRGLLAAVAGDEELIFPETRKWHSSRVNFCRPYWLYGFNEENVGGKLHEALQWYSTVTQRTVCKFPVDRVRAMYPMFFNTPCENQRELYGLIDDVAEATSKIPATEGVETGGNGNLRPKKQKAITWTSTQGGPKRNGDVRRNSTWQAKMKPPGPSRRLGSSTNFAEKLAELQAEESMRQSAGQSSTSSISIPAVPGTVRIRDSEISQDAKDSEPTIVTPFNPTVTATAMGKLPPEEETSTTLSGSYQQMLVRSFSPTDEQLLQSSQTVDLLAEGRHQQSRHSTYCSVGMLPSQLSSLSAADGPPDVPRRNTLNMESWTLPNILRISNMGEDVKEPEKAKDADQKTAKRSMSLGRWMSTEYKKESKVCATVDGSS